MSLPMPANVTFDVYRDGNAPPADPDVAAATGNLHAEFRVGLAVGQGPTMTDRARYSGLKNGAPSRTAYSTDST